MDLLLEFVKLFGKSFDSILKEYFLRLGLTIGVDEAFQGFFELDFGLFEGLVLVFIALKGDFEVLLDFRVGIVLHSGLVDKNLLSEVVIDLSDFFVLEFDFSFCLLNRFLLVLKFDTVYLLLFKNIFLILQWFSNLIQLLLSFLNLSLELRIEFVHTFSFRWFDYFLEFFNTGLVTLVQLTHLWLFFFVSRLILLMLSFQLVHCLLEGSHFIWVVFVLSDHLFIQNLKFPDSGLLFIDFLH